MPLFKNENELIRKLVVPALKEKKYLVKKLIKIQRRHQKLLSEEVLAPDEKDLEHPGQPDIDIVFWQPQLKPEEVIIHAAEIKYFRLVKGQIFPNFYDGINEAAILLTYGFDYVSLLHFFDSEVPEEDIKLTRSLLQNLFTDAQFPITYNSFIVYEPKFQIIPGFPYVLGLPFLPKNPMLQRYDVQKRRRILRKALRIV